MSIDSARQVQKNNFTNQFREITQSVKQRLADHEQALRSVKGLFIAAKNVTRDEFRNYVDNLLLSTHYPGIQGIGFSLIIPAQEINKHIAAIRKDSFPKYALRPEGKRNLYTSIIYLEPFAGINQRAFGYDMYSNTVRRAAMEHARDSDDSALSGKITLAQDNADRAQPGFLMYLPVYRNGMPHETLSDRRANIIGWVYAEFQMDDLMSGTLVEQVNNLGIAIFDGKKITAEKLLFYNNDDFLEHEGKSALYRTIKHIKVGDHTWTVSMHSLPAFEANLDTSQTNLIRLTGSIMSVLLSLLVWQLIAGRRRALDLAQELRIAATAFESHESMFIADADKNIIRVNPAFTGSTGYAPEEVIGKNPRIFSSGRQDGNFYAALWESINSTGAWKGEIWNRRKNGEIYPEYLTITEVKNKNGIITNYIATFNDITERKHTEEQLLNTMRELKEKELTKTRFLAAAGHDLRQPVAAASLFVDTLKLTSPTLRQRELIEKLDQSMSVLSNLLERLLDISKFDGGLIEPHITPYNLAELFNWLEQNFAQTAHDKQLRFRLAFSTSNPLLVRTDIGLLQSVMMNLVTNAIKFTAHGGILISARQRGDQVLMQVWDTGIGIAEAELPHIFDEFYQVANPQRDREAGLGLGLSICKRAMSLLGGKIDCRSRPGHGSVFDFYLPRDSAPPEIERPPTHNTRSSIADDTLFKDKRVVVVEDDALVSTGMVTLLQGFGAEVRYFYNAEDALKQADIASADFFIVDYALGGKLSGLEFLETLQQKQPTPIRAVVVTGETSSQFIISVAGSPWPVLHKPVNYSKLATSLRH